MAVNNVCCECNCLTLLLLIAGTTQMIPQATQGCEATRARGSVSCKVSGTSGRSSMHIHQIRYVVQKWAGYKGGGCPEMRYGAVSSEEGAPLEVGLVWSA